MKAVCWHGSRDVRVEDVPEPRILNPKDAIVEVHSTAICGSDVHLYDGVIPSMESGDILGHEFMGRVVEVGPAVSRVRVGDRVVVPFPIACGACWHCRREEWSLCDNTNPNAHLAQKMFGHSPAGIFGYSHLTGGYAGGQAEYVRVPFADVGCLKVPDSLNDEQVLFLSDILPTAYMAAEQGGVRPGDVVAIWGCGPVGLLAVKCAYLLGAERVISLDHEPYRMRRAEDAGAETLLVDDHALLRDRTGGRGPDVCIEAVGMEAHGASLDALYDRAATAVMFETDRPAALRQAILACRKGGTVSMAGVFGGLVDKIPFGAAFNKALTFRMGQTHVHKYLRPLLHLIERGELDASFIVSHRLPLSDAARGYAMFADHADDCTKVVLSPRN
ncbi:MAG: zinc-dependent alcohol dehydrogenase [Myxococcota bacterium]